MTETTQQDNFPAIPDLFPSAVAFISGQISDIGNNPLWPEEEQLMARVAEKRRMEFAAGRWCARTALAQLGQPADVLIKSEQGGVIWPNGFTGVISHTKKVCAAAVTRTRDIPGLGLDMEEIDRMSQRIAKRIMTDPEQAWLATQPPDQHNILRTVIFCAKEAIYKCLNPITRNWIGYEDASIIIKTTQQTLQVNLTERIASLLPNNYQLHGRYRFDNTLMVAGLWIRHHQHD